MKTRSRFFWTVVISFLTREHAIGLDRARYYESIDMVLQKVIFARILEFTRTVLCRSLVFFHSVAEALFKRTVGQGRKRRSDLTRNSDACFGPTGQGLKNGSSQMPPCSTLQGSRPPPVYGAGPAAWWAERAAETPGWKPCGESKAAATSTMWQDRQCHEAWPQLRQHTTSLRWTTAFPANQEPEWETQRALKLGSSGKEHVIEKRREAHRRVKQTHWWTGRLYFS